MSRFASSGVQIRFRFVLLDVQIRCRFVRSWMSRFVRSWMSRFVADSLGLNDYHAIFRRLLEVTFADWISLFDGMHGLEER